MLKIKNFQEAISASSRRTTARASKQATPLTLGGATGNARPQVSTCISLSKRDKAFFGSAYFQTLLEEILLRKEYEALAGSRKEANRFLARDLRAGQAEWLVEETLFGEILDKAFDGQAVTFGEVKCLFKGYASQARRQREYKGFRGLFYSTLVEYLGDNKVVRRWMSAYNVRVALGRGIRL